MRHEGEAAVQRRSGVRREDWGSARARPEIPAVAGDFLRAQRMIVVGAADASGRVWASALTGPAGFARPDGERTVVVGALPGRHDPLAALFGGEDDGDGGKGGDGGGRRTAAPAGTGQDAGDRDGHEIGMLAVEPETRRRMRVNGRARRDGDRLVVRTDQVYANCPKYIRSRKIVDGPPGIAAPGTASTTGTLTGGLREWIERADTFFVATRVEGLGADVSHRGGGPGFVRVVGDRRLVWPEYAGNLMYMTLGNLELDERCGLLFLDWETGDALHLTGRARVGEDPAGVPGAERHVAFDVDEAVRIGGAVPLRWVSGEHSRHNPPVARFPRATHRGLPQAPPGNGGSPAGARRGRPGEPPLF
ncbi:pyridoxamine 5'-phosphate oxidase family protein [Planomonospora sp. ID82291]|uniref:pyridoxamine 5'-phosphate oxidase family protein n=1 Tax=Planomonospora sp. ID82291 TaxID=2738136 RepID=UPI0018C3E10F|nr:pyridoxamine 5'-phosphate oxidase family protein [Planomonospora sp. ID82291]MBG0813520.1 pyridoxamine 5'-phosphate oxidase family protein [Planomonospora sp. ID82291]